MSDLQHGTKIYYTGDMANQSGFGIIVNVRPPTRWGPETYDIRFEDGREMLGIFGINIGDTYHGHCNPRFVTVAAYDAYRKARLQAEGYPGY